MLRNLIAVTAGAILSFLLQITGSWLAWRILVGDAEGSEYKSALVQLMLVQALGVTPIMAIVVGAFVAWLVQRSRWGLSGISLAPLYFYSLGRMWRHGVEVVLMLVYLLLALGAGFVVSHFKQRSSFESSMHPSS
jgi:hypothetical protein